MVIGPALGVASDSCCSARRTSAGLRHQDRQLPADHGAGAALAQGRASGQVDRVPHRTHAVGRPRQRADLPQHRGAGDERRNDPRLQGRSVRRRRRLPALRAARRRDLVAGGAGLLPLKHIRVDFTETVTNKCPTIPNRGYSRLQHLWMIERVIDIVAHELGFDPVALRKKNYVQPEDYPYRTPNGCIYDSGDCPAMLDMALEAIDYPSWRRAPAGAGRPAAASASASASARRSTPAPTTSASRASSTPPSVLGQRRGRVRQARPLRRGQRRPGHHPAGPEPRDDGGAGRGRHPRHVARTPSACPPASTPATTPTSRFSGTYARSSPSPASVPRWAPPRSCGPRSSRSRPTRWAPRRKRSS